MTTRRTFLLCWVPVVGAALSGKLLASPPADALDEHDAKAESLGYRHDASQVDKARFPSYTPGQTCDTCQVYQSDASSEWGGCPVFPGKRVNAKGWCSAYQ